MVHDPTATVAQFPSAFDITGVGSCSDNQQAKAIPFAGFPNAAIPTVFVCSKKLAAKPKSTDGDGWTA